MVSLKGTYWGSHPLTQPTAAPEPPLLKYTDQQYLSSVADCGKTEEQLRELGMQYINIVRLYGTTSWCDWCIEKAPIGAAIRSPSQRLLLNRRCSDQFVHVY